MKQVVVALKTGKIRSHLKKWVLVPRKKSGIFVKFKTGPNVNPQAYCSVPRS